MNYSIFGKTGKKVSNLGMGGMRFDKGISEDDCAEFIRLANRLGINYFDTAPMYNEDRSEDIYGRALQNMPKDFYIATKGQNHLTADKVRRTIEKSLKRLKVNKIDFYFLWCIISIDQYHKAREKGQIMEGISKAKKEGLIEHIGVSTHTYNDDIKTMADDDIFEFIMVPYNALNFKMREEGLRYAKKRNLGTVVMNPMYGGVIPQYKHIINIYPDSKNTAVEDAMKFCLESPFIDVSLSGMNGDEMIKENVRYADSAKKITEHQQNERQNKIHSAFSEMCTSCGYCLPHCPQNIDIPSYMEIYNTFMLTKSIEETKKRYDWYTKFGPLSKREETASDCIDCKACENECTQYLNITDRLKWIEEKFHQHS